MVSIIIPVYNVEKYLDDCLKSIISQSYKDWEMILIDDGSTDSSGEICDKYATKFQNIFTIHKQNGGVSSARNAGIKQAQGDWLFFCDADDILFEDALEILTKNFDQNVDSTMGGYIRINEKGDTLEENCIYEECRLSQEEVLIDFYDPKYKMFNAYIWNRLFRKSIINKYNLRFREDIYIKEDGLFLIQYLCKCNNGTYYNTKPIYKYIEHSSSAMNSKLKKINKEFISRLTATIECYKELKKSNYNNILPLAKNQIFYVRQKLLETDKSKRLDRISFMLFIDKLIAKELGASIMLKIYAKRIANWK